MKKSDHFRCSYVRAQLIAGPRRMPTGTHDHRNTLPSLLRRFSVDGSCHSVYSKPMQLPHPGKFTFAVAVLLITVGHAIISEVKNDACVNLIFCTLKSDKNYCQIYRGSEFVLEVDRDRWNIADEQRNRSTITEYGGYGCATFRNLQESDIGDYKLHIAKEDGLLLLRQNFLLTESVLDNLLNASNFNGSKSRIGERLLVPVYWRRNDAELPEALGLTAGNGTILKDFSLALVVTAQDPAKEKPMGVTTPTGTTPPPGNNNEILLIALSVLGVICLGVTAVLAYHFTRKGNPIIFHVLSQANSRSSHWRTTFSRIFSFPTLESIGGVADPKMGILNSAEDL